MCENAGQAQVQEAVLARRTERESEPASGEDDGSDYSIFSLVVMGGQE